MNFCRFLGLFIFLTCLISSANAEELTIDNMMSVKAVCDVSPSPDGKVVAYTVTQHLKTDSNWKDSTQIFVNDRTTHRTEQITFSNRKNTNPQWSPNGKWLAYLSNASGQSDLYMMDVTSKKSWVIVQSDTEILEFKWSPAGDMLAYVKENIVEKDLSRPIIAGQQDNCNNLWLVKLDEKAQRVDSPQQLTFYGKNQSCETIANIDWSPDQQNIVFSHSPASQHAVWDYGKISILNLQTKQIADLIQSKIIRRTLLKNKLVEHSPMYSPDNRSIALMNDNRVFVYSLDQKTLKEFPPTYDELPLQLLGWSADGKAVYILEQFHTYTHIIRLPIDGQPTDIGPPNKFIQCVGLSADKSWLAFSMEDSMHPAEVYLKNVDSPELEQLSTLNQNLNFPLGETKLIHWRSGNLDIEGLLTYPVNYQPGKRYPLLVEIHGGPGDVFSQKFIGHPSVYPLAIFANQGYAYLQPNIRGSSGYGLKFRNANYKDWGGKDFQDVLNGIQKVVDMGVADPKQIGILGWSYGGYLTAWAISHSKLFKAATIGGGITNLVSYTGTSDLPHFVPAALGYLWDNQKLYIERSPIFYVKNIQTPTLFQYGAEDVRVPPSQGYELYTALKIRGVPTELILYPNSHHAIRDPNLMIDAAKMNIFWLNKYVKPTSEE